MKQNVYVLEILTTEFVANKGLNRNSGLAGEEGGETPCGVAKRAFRKTLEYSAEGTRVLAAEYADALRTTPLDFAGKKNERCGQETDKRLLLRRPFLLFAARKRLVAVALDEVVGLVQPQLTRPAKVGDGSRIVAGKEAHHTAIIVGLGIVGV